MPAIVNAGARSRATELVKRYGMCACDPKPERRRERPEVAPEVRTADGRASLTRRGIIAYKQW
jgi:hypothetical protein